MDVNTIKTQCCIVGGGPAGMMLGLLLARVGIHITVLEKWPDFFRDFRGDTIHPSTLQILHTLELLEKFLALPHNEMRNISVTICGEQIPVADFSHLNVYCKFIAFLPQWDFLNFLAEEAKKYPTFSVMMGAEAIDLIRDNEKIIGVRAKKGDEPFDITCDLVVGADGRHSVVREKLQLPLKTLGAPMDVLWFRLSRYENEAIHSLGRIDAGKMMVMIERGDYFQCAFVVPKDDFEKIKSEGLDQFRKKIVDIAPMLKDRVHALTSWDQIKLLVVTVDCLKKWYQPGVICIGDAAHAMSPIAGVGINLAVQDAVAAANILIPAFLNYALSIDDLSKIQKRRLLPTYITQRVQLFMQNHLVSPALQGKISVPWPFKLLQKFPFLRRIPGRMIGMGARPELPQHKLRGNVCQ